MLKIRGSETLFSKQETFFIRVAFLFAGQFVFYEGFQNWNRGYGVGHVTILNLVTYALGFAMIWLSLSGDYLVNKLRDLPLLPLIYTSLVSVYVVARIAYQGSYRTDVLAFTHYAALRFLADGSNPYMLDLRDAIRIFGVKKEDLTPTVTGEYATNLQYPALHFLVYIPFILLGFNDMRIVLALFGVASTVILYFLSPKEIRPIVILPLFAGTDLMINFTASSVSDFLWVLPLLVAAFSMSRPFVSGCLYGLSCAIKQLPWLLAPFLLVYQWKHGASAGLRSRVKKVTKFALGSLLGFLPFNMPFMLSSPYEWFWGVLSPITQELVWLSQGLSSLAQVGLLNADKTFFTIAAAAVQVTLLVNYLIYYERLKYLHWIFPGIILSFSYRSLTNYFIYWTPLMVASLILWYRERAYGLV